jgi:hypothetical protein
MALKDHLKSMFSVSVLSLVIATSLSSFALAEVTGTTTLLSSRITQDATAAVLCQLTNAAVVGEAGTSGTDGVDGASGAKGATGATGACGPKGETGAAGAPTLWKSVSEDILPTEDNVFSIGSLTKRWKSLQLGPGTLYIQDQVTGAQAGLTVNAGTLLLDGADSLRIGNVQLTKTGIKSLLPDQDLTIGAFGDQGYLSLARALKFPDGTTQSTAMLNGLTGPQGASGPQGPQGVSGTAGATGPAGATGAQGVQGATGAQGVAGASVNVKGSYPDLAAFTAAALTGNPGDAWILVSDGSLMVWNTGTSSWNDVGDLQGPQGLTGPQGAQGPQGIQGIQGIQGVKGDTGATGPEGPAGTIAPYGKQFVCVKTTGKAKSMYWGTCVSNGLTSGTLDEYWILATFPTP